MIRESTLQIHISAKRLSYRAGQGLCGHIAGFQHQCVQGILIGHPVTGQIVLYVKTANVGIQFVIGDLRGQVLDMVQYALWK